MLIFLFRPKSVTDLARSMGQVVAEFKKGGREKSSEAPDALLVETGEKLGIPTEGKSSGQIRQEILAKARRRDN